VVRQWRSRDELPPDESLDVSEERGELEDFGDGRVGSLNRLTYTSKESGDVASVKMHRLVYTCATERSFATNWRISASPNSKRAPSD
jgi:hypothetical protein